MIKFQEQLDVLLLADNLHAKKCKKNHAPIWANKDNYCDYYVNHHNKNRVLGSQVFQSQAKQNYIKQAESIFQQCVGMNTQQIISTINTIIDE